MGTDCVLELGSTGATNCDSESFPPFLSKQLINKTTKREEGGEDVTHDPANVKVWILRIDWKAIFIIFQLSLAVVSIYSNTH